MDREILKGLQYSCRDALRACAPLCPPVAVQPQRSACVTREVVVRAAKTSPLLFHLERDLRTLSFQAVIKEQLQESHGLCEYAVYVQGMSRGLRLC